MASVLVTVLVLGVFIPIVQATTGAANEVRSRVIVDVYLAPDASDQDVERVRRSLNEDTPYVGKVQYVSKEDAYAAEKKRNPEAYELLGSNPLPDTFRVTPDEPGNVNALRDALLAGGTGGKPSDPAIGEIKNRRDDTDKLLSATRVVKLTTAVLTGLLIIASILLVGNTIRLSLFARRREVEVMRLVGATNWFIRWPFVIEGVILGAMGGVLAVLLLLVGQGRADRPAGRGLRPDRRAGHDRLPRAGAGPPARERRRRRRRVRALAASFPPRLERAPILRDLAEGRPRTPRRARRAVRRHVARWPQPRAARAVQDLVADEEVAHDRRRARRASRTTSTARSTATSSATTRSAAPSRASTIASARTSTRRSTSASARSPTRASAGSA